METINCLTFTR